MATQQRLRGDQMSKDERADDQSRRSFVKKAAYVAPVIITLDAMPAFASHECSWHTKTDDYEKGNNGVGKWTTIHSRQAIRRSTTVQAADVATRATEITRARAPDAVTDDGRKTQFMTIVDREAMNGQHSIGLYSCGRTFVIHCHDHETAALVRSVFGGLLASLPPAQSEGLEALRHRTRRNGSVPPRRFWRGRGHVR